MGEPFDAGASKVTFAPVAPTASATTFVGAPGLSVTVTVMVPCTTREGSPSLSLTWKPTEIVPVARGVTMTDVPEDAMSALPRDTAAPMREIGVSGKGFVAREATSTITVSSTRAFTEYEGTWMRGFVVETISTGIEALTVLPCSSVTLTGMEPADPGVAPSGAETVRTVPDSDADTALGAEPIA